VNEPNNTLRTKGKFETWKCSSHWSH